jgi:hypothetical protein
MFKVGCALKDYRFARKLVDLFASPACARSHVSRSLGVVHRGYELSNTANRRLALHARFFWGRRWPSGIPSARAFCLREPGVRLSALEMVLTGVLSLECRLSSFTSARVQSRRTIRFLLAIVFCSHALIAQLLVHVCTNRGAFRLDPDAGERARNSKIYSALITASVLPGGGPDAFKEISLEPMLCRLTALMSAPIVVQQSPTA